MRQVHVINEDYRDYVKRHNRAVRQAVVMFSITAIILGGALYFGSKSEIVKDLGMLILFPAIGFLIIFYFLRRLETRKRR